MNNVWIWDCYGKSVFDENFKDELIFLKEFFHVMYTQSLGLNDDDIKRFPIYQELRNNVDTANMFEFLNTNPHSIYVFDSDTKIVDKEKSNPSNFPYIRIPNSSRDEGMSGMNEIIFEPDGIIFEPDEVISEDELEENKRIKLFSFSRNMHVQNIYKKIELEDIKVIICYRKHPKTFQESESKKGGAVVGMLNDGRYFRIVMNLLSSYTDYNLGAIWISGNNFFRSIMSIDEDDPYVR